ncbi:hypothetical protein SCP_1303890 [Sparassis crispa]|uniref:Uncharacterized protein n=1 Tax=Sparassis crispa TaxID=139825 RepID=A0A401H2F1_9APHY|nr:hypothetical protein SCP_1303890 [Sparassis crispa]GBE88572.1 hypothetical protein SCP_1303890 [Sparassis crispa]
MDAFFAYSQALGLMYGGVTEYIDLVERFENGDVVFEPVEVFDDPDPLPTFEEPVEAVLGKRQREEEEEEDDEDDDNEEEEDDDDEDDDDEDDDEDDDDEDEDEDEHEDKVDYSDYDEVDDYGDGKEEKEAEVGKHGDYHVPVKEEEEEEEEEELEPEEDMQVEVESGREKEEEGEEDKEDKDDEEYVDEAVEEEYLDHKKRQTGRKIHSVVPSGEGRMRSQPPRKRQRLVKNKTAQRTKVGREKRTVVCLVENCQVKGTVKSRERHMLAEHFEGENKLWHCPTCKKLLSRPDGLRRHCNLFPKCNAKAPRRVDGIIDYNACMAFKHPWHRKGPLRRLRAPLAEHRDPLEQELTMLREELGVEPWSPN